MKILGVCGVALSGTLLAVTLFAVAAQGAPLTHAVQKACQEDYYKHCAKYQVGTSALLACMESVGKNLSRTCVRALIDAGEVSRAEIDRKRRR